MSKICTDNKHFRLGINSSVTFKNAACAEIEPIRRKQTIDTNPCDFYSPLRNWPKQETFAPIN